MSRGRARLLLADDYLDALEVWAFVLRDAGYDVITACTGREALDRARATTPALAILDLKLPDMPGLDVARRLRLGRSTAATRLLALTGYSRVEDERSARAAGFDDVLVKPCDPDVLISTVARLLSEVPPES